MPRYVALEWDSSEARLAVARVRSGHVDLEHALTVPLSPGDTRTAADLGKKIHDALSEIGVNGGEALVAVGRANIELRFLNVPPVPPEELPDLVRFQASRQFSQPIEEGLLDFAPLASSGSPPTSVLAAAITPELLKTIRDVCQAARLTPKHLMLRPFAADSLVTHRLEAESCVLTVDRLAEEVDLTVVLGGQAVFPRSVRVGNYGTPEDQASTIVSEMRRTIAAAQNQIAGHPVQSVLIFGQEAESKALAEAIRRELSLSVEFVDPFASVNAAQVLGDGTTASAGRFAPLIGALVDESRGKRHEIDFLSPRRRPEPPNRKRFYIALGSAVAATLLILCGMVYWHLSSLESEIRALQSESQELDKTLKAAKPKVDQATLIDDYAAGQIQWLDELRELAIDLPAGDKVILDELIATTGANPKIVIRGGAKAQTDVPELEAKLRDERHRVSGLGTEQVEKNKPYVFSFTETVEIVPASKAPAKRPPVASAKAPPAGRKS